MYAVPTVSLSGLTVGQRGQISLQATLAKIPTNPSAYGQGPTLRLYNDSGSALQIWDDAGTISDYVPAGAWPTYPISPDTLIIYFQVIAVLPNPPIQLLMLTIYAPGEPVPPTPQLGNSPVGIGGAVQTSSVQTLSQEGQSKVLLTIDIGDSVLAQLVTINNDGTAIWKVDVSGVAHTLLTLASAANFLKLSQAGDITEILGQLTVDQATTLVGALSGAAASFSGLVQHPGGASFAGGISGAVTLSGSVSMTAAGNALSVTNTGAFGGVNSNSFRDGTNGNLAMDLSGADGTAAFPQIMKPNKAVSQTSNGSVAGTVAFYTPIWGNSLKVLLVIWTGYNTTSVISFNFPSVMNQLLKGQIGSLGGTTMTVSLFRSGSAQSVDSITSLASTGGTLTALTTLHQASIVTGHGNQSYDQFQISGTSGAVVSGSAIFIGQ